MVKDNRGNLPLHMALRNANVTPAVIQSLLSAAPFAGRVCGTDGKMPIHVAMNRRADGSIIKNLLALDMPIEIGGKERVNDRKSLIVHRKHGHSWWHAAIRGQDRYLAEIKEVLLPASYAQIVALANTSGPESGSTTEEAAPEGLTSLFQELLRFNQRYEICTDVPALVADDFVSFHAVDNRKDRNGNVNVEGTATETASWSDDGYVALTVPNRRDEEVEVSFMAWNGTGTDVKLNFYAFQDDFEAEKEVRNKFNISPKYCEQIVGIHKSKTDKNAALYSNAQFCIAFEYPDTSLANIYDWLPSEKRQRLRSCRDILRNIATSVKYLHDKGVVHGNLDPTTVARYKQRWKLTRIGGVTLFGCAMGGHIRRSAPPEAAYDENKPAKVKRADQIDDNLPVRDGMISVGDFRSTDLSSISNPTYKSIEQPPQKERRRDVSPRKHLIALMQRANAAAPKAKFWQCREGIKPISEKSEKRKKSRSEELKIKIRDIKKRIGILLHSSKKDTGADQQARDELLAQQEEEIARLRDALSVLEVKHVQELEQEKTRSKLLASNRNAELAKEFIAAAKEIGQTPSAVQFAPEMCIASPAWDTWSFGVMMAQLLTGGKHKEALPSHSETDESFLQKLISFDQTNLENICRSVKKDAGERAADLVEQLLDPSPYRRMKSMNHVLSHRYFDDDTNPLSRGRSKERPRKQYNSQH